MTEQHIPPERDFPAGRLTALEDDVMAETMAIEFLWDEHDGDRATMSSYRRSTSPIGECRLVEAPEIVVDAENGIVGG